MQESLGVSDTLRVRGIKGPGPTGKAGRDKHAAGQFLFALVGMGVVWYAIGWPFAVAYFCALAVLNPRY